MSLLSKPADVAREIKALMRTNGTRDERQSHVVTDSVDSYRLKTTCTREIRLRPSQNDLFTFLCFLEFILDSREPAVRGRVNI